MTDQWTDRLSEYLDGELTSPERTAFEAHLASCDACRTWLDELRRVVPNARALDDRPPAADLWPVVAARIGLSARSKTRPVRRFSFTMPQLAAASVVLALLSGGTAWLLGGRRTVATPPVVISQRRPPLLNASAYPGDARYAGQVADLQRALQPGPGQLDTATVAVIHRDLRIIDRAIRNAQS